MTATAHSELPDFAALKERFEKSLTPGQQAELRRVGEPEDLIMQPALYRLLQGKKPNSQYLRLVFLLPWATHRTAAPHFSAVCAKGKDNGKAKVNAMRLFQIVRSDDPNDMIQLRRVAMQIKPVVDWNRFGRMLWYWHWPHTKRELIENYYLVSELKPESVEEFHHDYP